MTSALQEFRNRFQKIPREIGRHINGFIFVHHRDNLVNYIQYREELLQRAPKNPVVRALEMNEFYVWKCIDCQDICEIDIWNDPLGPCLKPVPQDLLAYINTGSTVASSQRVYDLCQSFQNINETICIECLQKSDWKEYIDRLILENPMLKEEDKIPNCFCSTCFKWQQHYHGNVWGRPFENNFL